MIDGLRIFDAHMHNLGIFKKKDESLVQFLDRYGIDKAILSPVDEAINPRLKAILDENISEVDITNQFLSKKQLDHQNTRELVSKNPDRFVGFYWFNPRNANEEDWRLLRKYIENFNFKGVKTQANIDCLRLPEDFNRLAEFCVEYDLPLYFHSGYAFFFQKSYQVKDIYNLVHQYKDLKLIIGHAAYSMEYCISLLRYFPKYQNVFFETSTSVPYGIKLLIKIMGNHRVIYGSDAPAATTPDIEIQKIKILNLDQKTLENVFYNNITNLIGNN